MNAVEQLYTLDIIEIVLDLPLPPSVNSIWRAKRRGIYRAEKYLNWLDAADKLVTAARSFPKGKIRGRFSADFKFDERAGAGDLDNRIKGAMDWLVSRDVVSDDVHCRKLTAEWVKSAAAPAGCRVVLRSIT